MCLIIFNLDEHPDYRLVLAANRDERHDRPTASMAFWEEQPDLLAGRDLEAGGTWFGVTKAGRWAAVTNFHGAAGYFEDAPTRGNLVRGFLQASETPKQFLLRLRQDAGRYNGFSLLVGNANEVYFFSNQSGSSYERGDAVKLKKSTYGLSNHLLNTSWPKVVRARSKLEDVLKTPEVLTDPLLQMMRDDTPPTEEGGEEQRFTRPMFISGKPFGTRSTTAMTIRRDGRMEIAERRYDSDGQAIATQQFSFTR